jgi:thiol-disulfide isomerase/thioredoxin
MKLPGPVPALIAAAVVLQACGRAAPRSEAGAAAGYAPAAGVASDAAAPLEAAPVATVSFGDMDRVRADLAALKGKPVFLNFWATWCAPCMEELPDLAALAREAGGENMAFLGISLDSWVTGEGTETGDKVRKALASAGVSYPNVVYTGDQDPLLEGFRLPGSIPYSILYDPEGRDVARFDGQTSIEEVRRAMAQHARKKEGAPRPQDPSASH